jgi:hypothetical protein
MTVSKSSVIVEFVPDLNLFQKYMLEYTISFRNTLPWMKMGQLKWLMDKS